MATITELVDWVVATGKNLTMIYISYAYGDYFYGNGALLKKFLEAKIVAILETISRIAEAISPEGIDAF
ncbi:metallo-beta-lactamase domain protein [Penicillium lividum]|nr:metallo-beta-lactamase domain protein [Penicillium lividum]